MTRKLSIDFVSDISCSWCAVGLNSLELALAKLKDDVEVSITFHPFELNANMPAGGQNLAEHLQDKYGLNAVKAADSMAHVRSKGADVGFDFRFDDSMRIYNTFNTHQLLHWALLKGKQVELKKALFKAHFTDQGDPGDRDLLVRLAESVGLDSNEASAVLDDQRYAADVRSEERKWMDAGVTAVPAIIFNGRYALTGARSPEAYEEAIRTTMEDGSGASNEQ